MLLRCWGKDQERMAALFPPDERERDEDGCGGVLCYWRPPQEIDRILAGIKDLWVMRDTHREESEDDSLDKTVVATLRCQGKDYVVRYHYGYGFDDHNIEWNWTENNLSCNCCRAALINEQYDTDFPDHGEGDGEEVEEVEVELIDLDIQYTVRHPLTAS